MLMEGLHETFNGRRPATKLRSNAHVYLVTAIIFIFTQVQGILRNYAENLTTEEVESSKTSSIAHICSSARSIAAT